MKPDLTTEDPRRRLKSLLKYRPAASALIERVSKGGGRVAIFGGAVRDMARDRPRKFGSDLDLVVEDLTAQDIEQAFNHPTIQKISQNRFGGWRLLTSCGQIDVWQLGMTWAFRQRLVAAEGFTSLLQTTFFSCDAAVYEVETKTLHTAEEVPAHWCRGLVELNLARNPNPRGTVVRTLRHALDPRLHLGPKLVEWLLAHAYQFSARELCDADQSSFSSRRRLTQEKVVRVLEKAERHREMVPLLPFPASDQLVMPLRGSLQYQDKQPLAALQPSRRREIRASGERRQALLAVND